MLWTIFFIVLIVYIALKSYENVYHWKLRGVKNVTPLPLVGSFWKSMFKLKSFIDNMQEVYKFFPNAKFIGVHQMNRPTLMVRDPEIIRQITIKNFDNFVDHTVLFNEKVEPLFGRSLVSLKGQRWRNMRATISPAFTSAKMKKMYILIKACAEQFTENFVNLEKQKGTLELEMLDTFRKYTNDVIATCAFGITCNSLKDENNEFYQFGKKITTFTLKTNLKVICMLIMPKLMEMFGTTVFSEEVNTFFLDIIKSTIEYREKNNIISPDMIHLLMEARKGQLKHESEVDEDAGFATVQESEMGKEHKKDLVLTDEDITAQAVLFFMAGFDTTSTMMHFLAYELAVNHDVQKKLQAEIDETLQKCSGDLDYNSLLKMKYLDMVICESLRKWPPAALTERICNLPYKLIDEDQVLLVEKDQSVWIPVYGIHHDSKYFPNPEKFDPERFSDENKHNITPFTYLPFGEGPRNCIGSRFALLEIKTLIASILSKFDIVPTEKTQIPLRFSKHQFAMKTENGVWLEFKRRS